MLSLIIMCKVAAKFEGNLGTLLTLARRSGFSWSLQSCHLVKQEIEGGKNDARHELVPLVMKCDNLNGFLKCLTSLLPHLTSKDSYLRCVGIATCISWANINHMVRPLAQCLSRNEAPEHHCLSICVAYYPQSSTTMASRTKQCWQWRRRVRMSLVQQQQ